jgi:hypothetical protein
VTSHEPETAKPTVLYLVHSMGAHGDYLETDRVAAPDRDGRRVESKRGTGCGVPGGVVIGSGSLSFELIRALVDRLPVTFPTARHEGGIKDGARVSLLVGRLLVDTPLRPRRSV